LATWDVGQNFATEWPSRINAGENLHIGRECNFLAHGGIKIGSNVTIGKGVQIINVSHPSEPDLRHLIKCAPIHIEDGVIVGDHSIIINPGNNPVVLSEKLIIPDGSLVFKSSNQNNAIKKIQRNFSDIETNYDLKNCIVTNPVYVNVGPNSLFFDYSCGRPPLINRGSYINIHPSSSANIGHSLMMAPSSCIVVEEGASLSVGNHVWLGAGARVEVLAGSNVKIGDGSIIAAGAISNINVGSDMIVINSNEQRAINAVNNDDLPHEWIDPVMVGDALLSFHRALGRIQ
jgi:acetyltransferase-like isoleucine patch superfamily enzyme